MNTITWQRLVAWFLAIFPAAFVGYVGVHQLAQYQPRLLMSLQAQMDQASASATQLIVNAVDEMPAPAAKLAEKVEVATTLRTLRAQVNLVPAGGTPNERVRARIEATRASLTELVSSETGKMPEVQGVALLDAAGVVMWSNIPFYAVGARLGGILRAAPKPAADGDESGENAAQPPANETPKAAANAAAKGAPEDTGLPHVVAAMSGTAGKAALVHQGGLYLIGAAPIITKNKVSGVALVERKLTHVTSGHINNVALFSSGSVIAGAVPPGIEAAATRAAPTDELPFIVSIARIKPRLWNWFDVSVGPFGFETNRIGVYARRVSVPLAPQAWGLVFADVSEGFVALANGQVSLLAALLVIALFSLLACEMTRLRLLICAERLADTLGRAQQGKGDVMAVQEKRMSPELRRLGRLVNKAAMPTTAAPGPNAPSIDDVLQASGDLAPDPADLEFAGFTDGKKAEADAGGLSFPSAEAAQNLPAETQPFPAPLPEETANDGYESLAPVAESLADTAQLNDQLTQLPEVPDALAAMEQLGDQLSEMPSATAAETEPAAEAEPMAEAEPVTETEALAEPEPEPVPVPRPVMPTLPTAPVAAPEASSGANDLRTIFGQFVATRKQCGETVADLTFEKFSAKLESTRSAVIAKHQCREVRFEVYVKDGRAALRATPAR